VNSTDRWLVPLHVSNEFEWFGLLPPELEILLRRRGYESKELIKEYLFPSSLPDVNEHFPELQKAVERLQKACNTNETVAICGDYDADGMTSTALLTNVLKELGADPKPIIPSRHEDGYGININIVNRIYKRDIKLIVTVDNGVSAHQAIEEANKLDIQVILSDHHIIKNALSGVYALIHPETTPKNSPYKVLAGVGLAYIIASELCRRIGDPKPLSLSRDLFCIGTIADMSSLNGANRFLTKQWINKLVNTKSLGLKGLLMKSKIDKLSLTSEDISFKIAPRINSIGRISDPKLILDLFLEQDEKNVKDLVDKCETINTERRLIVDQSQQEALYILSKENIQNIHFIFLAQSHWHKGVIGLIASRTMEKYSKPSAILTEDSEGIFRGSVRSPPGFNVVEALDKCSKHLEQYGGHSAAAGFTVKAKNINKLQESLNEIARSHFEMNGQLLLKPEVYLNLTEIDQKFLDKLNLFEPFGVGNPKPLFWVRGVEVIKQYYLNKKHLSLVLQQNEFQIKAMIWNSSIPRLTSPKVDIVFNIDKSNYNNKSEHLINIKAVKEFTKLEKFSLKNRTYYCSIEDGKLEITNMEGRIKQYYLDDIKSISNVYMKKLVSISLSILGIYPS